MSLGKTRLQRSDIPDAPTPCAWPNACVYRDESGICDEPRTNKGNSDAECHKMPNRQIIGYLVKP
jgi:hypothetical protein